MCNTYINNGRLLYYQNLLVALFIKIFFYDEKIIFSIRIVCYDKYHYDYYS